MSHANMAFREGLQFESVSNAKPSSEKVCNLHCGLHKSEEKKNAANWADWAKANADISICLFWWLM